jgi:hypothetical protein
MRKQRKTHLTHMSTLYYTHHLWQTATKVELGDVRAQRPLATNAHTHQHQHRTHIAPIVLWQYDPAALDSAANGERGRRRVVVRDRARTNQPPAVCARTRAPTITTMRTITSHSPSRQLLKLHEHDKLSRAHEIALLGAHDQLPHADVVGVLIDNAACVRSVTPLRSRTRERAHTAAGTLSRQSHRITHPSARTDPRAVGPRCA